MGDTHIETDVLPSSGLFRSNVRSSVCSKRFETNTTLMTKSDRHKATLMDEE